MLAARTSLRASTSARTGTELLELTTACPRPQISTERLSVASLAAASPRTFTASSWVPFPLSLLAPTPSLSLPSTSSTSSSSPSPSPAAYPLYALTLSYAHSSSAGKALLHRAQVQLVSPCGAFFDGEGRLARGRVEEWVEGGLREVQGSQGGAGEGR